MPRLSAKAFTILLIAGGIAVAAVAQNKEGRHEEHRAQNLTILPKDTPNDSLIALMKEYSVSLGVRCGFCHAQAADGKHLDFASDDNGHKKIARYMMTMTSGINAKYFAEENGGEHHTALMVSCYTCHHGHNEPEAFVMPKNEERR